MKNYLSVVGLICFFVVILSLSLENSFGQSVLPVSSIDSVAKFEAIPSDLAFDLLGISGNNIEQPGTLSSFLASITPAVDLQGHISPGIAVSFAPYQLLEGDKLQLKDYVDNPFIRILSNTHISLGTAPTKDADSSQEWGIGARIVLFNSGDGRLNTDYLDLLAREGIEAFQASPLDSKGLKDPSKDFADLHLKARKLFAQISPLIHSGDSLNLKQIQSEISPYLDSLDTIADEMASLNNGFDHHLQVDSLHSYIARYSNPMYIQGIRKAILAAKIKNTIRSNNDSPDWNTTSLDLNIGTVYKAANGNVQQSAFSKYQAWISGGLGFGNSQILAQLGIYHQFAVSGQTDSTFATTALMFRYGGKDLRLGVGANAMDFDHGTMNIVAELRLSSKAWIVASFNREFAKDMSPTWTPSITVKATGGAFGF